ncbi:MAG: hypothetical protein DMF63_16915 [Acidobacteria bacterium]|nr:MAG: hypothetical protein DMF63_16915 [Acidobacteriota bacterium]
MKKVVFLFFVLFVSFVSIQAQMQQDVTNRQAEMKKLDKLVGTWKGSGWYSVAGGKRENFTSAEVVQRKIDGLAMLVEGKHINPEGKVIHETLAVISYDEPSKIFKFSTYLATGPTGNYDFKVVLDGYEWGFKTPAGTIRYLIKADNDVWSETGEFSRDGQAWVKIFEMKLDRVK